MAIKQFEVGDVLLIKEEFQENHERVYWSHPLTVIRVDRAPGTSWYYADVEVKDLFGQEWTISANEAHVLHSAASLRALQDDEGWV
jgi:hypothetical protein